MQKAQRISHQSLLSSKWNKITKKLRMWHLIVHWGPSCDNSYWAKERSRLHTCTYNATWKGDILHASLLVSINFLQWLNQDFINVTWRVAILMVYYWNIDKLIYYQFPKFEVTDSHRRVTTTTESNKLGISLLVVASTCSLLVNI